MLQLSWLGRRVTVRRVLAGLEPGPDGRPRLGDVVGDLVGLDARTAVLDSRDGLVEVELDHVTAARPALPSTADELALEAVAARGVRPAETADLGGWVLRADHGTLRRTNSVLPLRPPGMPLDEALARAHDWYAARGLPLRIAVPVEARRLLDAELAERGWPAQAHTRLMTARLDLARTSAPPLVADGRIVVTQATDEAWLSVYRGGAGASAAHVATLERHELVTFAQVVAGDRTIAIGRGVVDGPWLGISALEVQPQARRGGLATAVMAALSGWGRERGATRGYLQVESDNEPASALYRSLGYHVHHEYHYLTEPERPDISTSVTAPASVPPSSTP